MENSTEKKHDLESIRQEAELADVKSQVREHYTVVQGTSGNFVVDIFGGFFRWIFDSIQVIIIALAIFVIFYLFIFSPHTIQGRSMQPNFCEGDLLLADKLTPRFKDYQIGDVIVFEHSKLEDYIKRIIGKGGDVIRIEAGKVYRNGQLIDEPYLPAGRLTTLHDGDALKEGEDYIVPEGKFMVFGDNRPESSDSRSFLAIDPNENIIKGRVKVILWPFDRTRIFKTNDALPVNECLRR
jgi:signal peptidase I